VRAWSRRVVPLLLALLLVACEGGTPNPTATPTRDATPSLEPTEVPTATPAVGRLTLCTLEPASVSPFAPSQPGTDLLALFHEPPAEQVDYRWEARLLTHVPSVEEGDVVSRTVSVRPGARYADETGTVLINEGEADLALPQLEVTFELRDDLAWSDGTSITSEDAILGYHLAQEPEARGYWRELAEHTERFEALDERTLRWTGVPGFITTDYPGFLFPLQPGEHYRGQGLAEILRDQTPPATGPFMITSWETGVGARLRPNPHYAGDAPRLEEVIVRFPQYDVRQWPQLLANGECDLILPTAAMQVERLSWARSVAQGAALIWASVGPQPSVLRLDFNLEPVDGEESPLQDRRVREALAYCINRGRLVEAIPDEALVPAQSFLPPLHPALQAASLTLRPYDPELGQELLEDAGWRDEDEDGVREAYEPASVEEGEPLSLTLILAPQYTVSAAHVAADLGACGVGVSPEPVAAQDLYAASAGSPLFGRTFDLALFGWWAEVPQVCGAWRSDRIPNEENAWIGENFSGYSSEAYDAACRRALRAAEPEVEFGALSEAAALLHRDLPTAFLVWRPFWFAAHPRVNGLRPDASNPATLWNIEQLYLGE
jgi:peptide/nickel transport system substrate-binding protein